MAYTDILYEKKEGVGATRRSAVRAEGRDAFVEKRPVSFDKFRK